MNRRLATLLIILILELTSIIIYGVLRQREGVQRPPTHNVFPRMDKKPLRPICTEQAYTCTTDKDCEKCIDSNSFELKCQPHKIDTGMQKYCLPVKPKKECNEKLGGVWTWTGWGESGTKEWDCLCVYPEIAGNRGCTRLNPGVCDKGTYTYDARGSSRGPSPDDCKCAEGYDKIVANPDIPMCIKHTDGIDASFY